MNNNIDEQAASTGPGLTMVITNPFWQVQSWSYCACARYGYTEHEALGQNIAFLFADAAGKPLYCNQNIQPALAGGTLTKRQSQITKAGRVFETEVTFTALYDANSRLTTYQIMLQAPDGEAEPAPLQTDSGQNGQAAEGPGSGLLAQKVQFIQTITDNLPAMIAYYSAGLQCLFANQPYQDYFGHNGKSVIGCHKRDLMHPAEFNTHQQHLYQVLAGNAQRFERNFVKNTGETIYTLTQYLPDFDGHAVKGFYSLIYDISEVKEAQTEVAVKATQIADLLENIDDGFITIDFELKFSYANKRMGQLVNMEPTALVGKHILALFPEAEGSVTFKAIQKALRQREYICNEDYFAPLDLWQENRIYPSAGGVSIFIRDISERKRADDRLRQYNERFRLMSRATNDALFEWNLETNEVWWSESHFTLFGFDPKGPVPSQHEWLQRLHPNERQMFIDLDKRIREKLVFSWQQEVVYLRANQTWGTLLNRGFVVVNARQQPVRILASFMDITDRKNAERQKELVAYISQVFNEQTSLNLALQQVLQKALEHGGATLAEIWLTSADQQRIILEAKSARAPQGHVFFDDSADIKNMARGEGLPGTTLAAGVSQFWRYDDPDAGFVRRGPAIQAGLKSAFSIPLFHNQDVIGVLIQRFDTDDELLSLYPGLFEAIGQHLGTEIKNKQLAQQLQQVFDCAPDMICIAGTDSYFKKVNPAMNALLGYTTEELLSMPIDKFLHPADVAGKNKRMQAFAQGTQTIYFENRYISKSGKIIWLSWTVSRALEDGLLFCVGKDVSDKKELQMMLEKATDLARIGGWEADLILGKVYWSAITRQIMEVDAGFEPDIQKSLDFYGEGQHRRQMVEAINRAIDKGIRCYAELQITTAKGKIKWVRVVAEAEYNAEGVCIRVHGSFQDIDKLKRAEIAAKVALAEKKPFWRALAMAFLLLTAAGLPPTGTALPKKPPGGCATPCLANTFGIAIRS